MPDPKKWKPIHWTMITGGLAFLVLLSQSIGALTTTLEPYLPSTREWTREMIQSAEDANARARQKLADALTKNDASFLELKMLLLDGQISDINNQINSLNLRLSSESEKNDTLLLNLKSDYERKKNDLERSRNTVACERVRIDFPNANC